MMGEPLNCPFCGSKIHRVVSMARSFKPPREWLEFQHEEPTTNCFLYNRIGRVIAVTADSYNRLGEFLTAWNIRADAWRPIESAPKDGTEVLLWATPYSMLNPNSVRIVGHYDRGWWDNTSCVLSHVTAWQPLPAPPSAQAQKPAEETRSEAE